MAKEKFVIGDEGIHDARVLGIPKMIVLGFQHMFAMFGATVLVPLLTGLDVAVTLLMAGLGTLFFHLVTGGKVPAFLGSSFAFLGGYAAVTGLSSTTGMSGKELLPYACIGVACAGLVYLVLALLVKSVGIKRVMKFFPPVVTGPIIIAIGLGLAGSAVTNCSANWLIALIALAIVIIFNVWGKGMAKIIPILLGVLGSCLIAAILALGFGETIAIQTGTAANELKATEEISIIDAVKDAQENGGSIFVENIENKTKVAVGTTLDAAAISFIEEAYSNGAVVTAEIPTYKDVIAIAGNPSLQLFEKSKIDALLSADWFAFPIKWESTVFGGIDWSNVSLIVSAIIMIIPISLATMMEHIGDISAISSTVGKNFIADPGLHRTLIGDGVATSLAALVGAPANTTYGENTGVLALSKVYDPRVVRLAAIFAILFSFSPKFEALVNLIPTSVIGGISFILYGMISAVGVRNVVENKVDFTKSRNLLIAAIILVCALGLGTAATFAIGGMTISLSALAVASIAGIVLNAILPGKDYVFGEDAQGDKAANMAVGSNTENYGK